MIRVKTHAQRLPDGFESDLVLQTDGRWLRLGAFYGTPPGSHIGLWRTRWGSVRGVNLRVGRRYIGPCLTLLIHTRPVIHNPGGAP